MLKFSDYKTFQTLIFSDIFSVQNFLHLLYPYLIMSNLFTKNVPTSVAEKYYTMKNLTSKLQSANIGFINRAIHNIFLDDKLYIIYI